MPRPDSNTTGSRSGHLSAPHAAEYTGMYSRRRIFLARTATIAVAAMAGLICAVPGHGENIRTVDIEIRNGKVVGKNALRVSRGDTVVLRWSSDKRLELHLHAYDVQTTVSLGGRAEMRIRAHATGRFPVEIHGQGRSGGGHDHRAVFHLEVYPG